MSTIQKVQPIRLSVPVTTDISKIEDMVGNVLTEFDAVKEQVGRQASGLTAADAKLDAIGAKQSDFGQSLATQQSVLARIEKDISDLATAVRGLHYAIDQIAKSVSRASEAAPRPGSGPGSGPGPGDAGPGATGAGIYPGGRGPDEPVASRGPTQEPPPPPPPSAAGWGRPFRVVSGFLVFLAIAVAAYGAFAKL